jgi:Ni/Fe-hydrogenase subunit HybB-like protein
MVSLRDSIPDSCRSCYTAGTFCTHHCIHGLCNIVIPGWHTTIFPPYFVAGAIFSGFAMVLTLMIITRKTFKLEDYITLEHVESMNKVIILTGSIVGVAYITEFFIAWYSGVEYEQYAFINRATGPYWWAYWA